MRINFANSWPSVGVSVSPTVRNKIPRMKHPQEQDLGPCFQPHEPWLGEFEVTHCINGPCCCLWWHRGHHRGLNTS